MVSQGTEAVTVTAKLTGKSAAECLLGYGSFVHPIPMCVLDLVPDEASKIFPLNCRCNI